MNLDPMARTADPETSHEAAESVMNLTDYRLNALNFLMHTGPLTDDQLVAAFASKNLAHTPSGVRTRRNELVRMGLVKWTGEYALSNTGRRARTWEASL